MMSMDTKQICGYQGPGEWGMTANGYGISFQCDKSILELDSGDSCQTLWICYKTIELYTLKGQNLWYVNYFSTVNKSCQPGLRSHLGPDWGHLLLSSCGSIQFLAGCWMESPSPCGMPQPLAAWPSPYAAHSMAACFIKGSKGFPLGITVLQSYVGSIATCM